MDKVARISRLQSILRQFPCPHRALDLGCGDDDELAAYIVNQRQLTKTPSDRLLIVSVDRTLSGLRAIQRRKNAQSIQADLTTLPFSRQATFDFILVRHPDIDRSAEQWKTAFSELPALLHRDGILLVTTYSAAEMEQIQGWLLVPTFRAYPVALDRLAPPDLVGRDRVVRAYLRSP